MDIFPASEDHGHLVEKAFAAERDQRFTRYVDYMALPAVSDFHAQRVLNQLKKADSEKQQFIVIDHDRMVAYFSIQPSSWHAQHFGHPYYKLHPFYCMAEDEKQLEGVVSELMKKTKQQSSGVFSTRIDAFQAGLIYTMIKHGFVQVGTSMRMVKSMPDPLSVDKENSNKYDTIHLREFESKDLPAIQDIGRYNHTHSHFFCERQFSHDKVRELFAEWLYKCVTGVAQQVFVADIEGKVAGFATLLIGNALVPFIDKRIGVIDFIVVDRRYQGKGVGRALLNKAMNWFAGRVEIVELRTMADNLSALRFYESNGFRVLSADQHLHCWT